MAVMDDGYQTTISLTGAGVTFKEKSLKPPGMDGGDAIDTTTMRNTTYRTFAPRALVTATEISCMAAWDPAWYDSILATINVNQAIVVTFPDNATITFWGFLKGFEPSDNSEGEQPEATVTIVPSNQDAAGDEIAPVYVAGS